MQFFPVLIDFGQQAFEMLLLAAAFSILARLVKGGRWLADARAAVSETRCNVVLFLLDKLTVAPLLAVAALAVSRLTHAQGAPMMDQAIWRPLGPLGTGLTAVFLCDFFGYCNHRLYHTRWLWPSHAIHHSDTRMTWFTLLRMHPVDRLGALADVLGLILLGFPDWAVVLAVSVRHYYGHLIHADLPWTFGAFQLVFISPAMHRWHHAREQQGEGANFATVFSVFDRLFGTYYAPGPCLAATGIEDSIAPGVSGLYLHPFRAWLRHVSREPQPYEKAPDHGCR